MRDEFICQAFSSLVLINKYQIGSIRISPGQLFYYAVFFYGFTSRETATSAAIDARRVDQRQRVREPAQFPPTGAGQSRRRRRTRRRRRRSNGSSHQVSYPKTLVNISPGFT